jgi:hypothetical protein
MAFVKVVGGIEIYNFCIQSFVHFYTNFWSYLISNSGPAKRLGHGAAAPRRHARPRAGRPFCPHHAQPEATRPYASAPRCASFLAMRVSPRRRAIPTARTGRIAGLTRAPAIRASVATPPHHGGIFVVSTPSPPSTYLRLLPFLGRTMSSRPTLAAPHAMDAVATEHYFCDVLATKSLRCGP